MRSIKAMRWLAGAMLACAACSAGAAVTPDENVVVFRKTILDQGISRSIVYVRPRQAPTVAPPAFFLLPYRNGTADDMADLVRAGRLARDYGAWVIIPEAFTGLWNYKMLLGPLTTPNDLKFLDRVIDDAVSSYGVDAHRLYMGGYSGGAMMTMRYLCERPGRIAAATVVGAQMIRTLASKCGLSPPAAVTFVNGLDDPVGPYAGDSTLMSAPESAAYWAAANGCNAVPLHQQLPDLVDDGTTVAVDRYSGCGSGEAVRLYTVTGGGHTWPGAVDFTPSLGATTQDFDATTTFMQFLLQFSR
ncbi:MAG: alpha/beta hydrolase family esterase [Solimonas sp.]